MPFLTQGKTNWKYILIVLILAILVGGGILTWIKSQQIEIPPTNPLPEPPLGNEDTSNWKSYSNSHYNIELRYPPYWQLKEEATYAHRYEGKDGFFLISAVSGQKLSIDEVCKNEAYHKLEPYGSEPKIEKLKIDNQDACLIIPSADQVKAMKNQSALIVHYPQPIQISGETYNYFILYADKNHINEIAKTLKFIRDETADWKTYRNEKYEYRIKYPADWEISIKSSREVSWSSPYEKPGERKYILIYVATTKDPKKSPLHLECESPNEFVINWEYVTIGDKKFCRYLKMFDVGFQGTFYEILKNNKLYQIVFGIERKDLKKGFPLSEGELQPEWDIFNQMITSFEFID